MRANDVFEWEKMLTFVEDRSRPGSRWIMHRLIWDLERSSSDVRSADEKKNYEDWWRNGYERKSAVNDFAYLLWGRFAIFFSTDYGSLALSPCTNVAVDLIDDKKWLVRQLMMIWWFEIFEYMLRAYLRFWVRWLEKSWVPRQPLRNRLLEMLPDEWER